MPITVRFNTVPAGMPSSGLTSLTRSGKGFAFGLKMQPFQPAPAALLLGLCAASEPLARQIYDLARQRLAGSGYKYPPEI